MFHFSEATLPTDSFQEEGGAVREEDVECRVEMIRGLQRDIRHQALNNISDAQVKQKRNYDKRHANEVC